MAFMKDRCLVEQAHLGGSLKQFTLVHKSPSPGSSPLEYYGGNTPTKHHLGLTVSYWVTQKVGCGSF